MNGWAIMEWQKMVIFFLLTLRLRSVEIFRQSTSCIRPKTKIKVARVSFCLFSQQGNFNHKLSEYRITGQSKLTALVEKMELGKDLVGQVFNPFQSVCPLGVYINRLDNFFFAIHKAFLWAAADAYLARALDGYYCHEKACWIFIKS